MAKSKSKSDNRELVYLLLVILGIAALGVTTYALTRRSTDSPLLEDDDELFLEDGVNDQDFTSDEKVDSRNIEKFKIPMHAFISMVSMEKVGCEILTATDPNCYTCLTRDSDPGWEPKVFHDFFQKILSNINVSNLSLKTKELIAIWKQHSSKCDEFFLSNNFGGEHFSLISKFLNYNDVVIYPWRTNDHTVYIEIFKDSYSYRIRIFDFGAGRQFLQQSYQPIEFKNLTEQGFTNTILSFTTRYGSYLSDEELSYLYKNEAFLCTSCMPEYKQETGNCVVKNLLAAIQQDSIDRYGTGRGVNVFSEFYVAVLDAILDEAQLYVSNYFISELPDFNTLCDQIKKTQMVFTWIPSTKLQQIEAKYEKIRELCTTKDYNSSSPSVCFSQTNLPPQPSFFLAGGPPRDTGLRRHGADKTDIRNFFNSLEQALNYNRALDENEIPASLRGRHVDTHQRQHLIGNKDKSKSKFYSLIATDPNSPTLNALANAVNKLVSEYCKRNRITGDESRFDNFIVDVGFSIGALRGKLGETSCIKIEGFTGQTYHIFPVSPDERGIKIDLSTILGEGRSMARSLNQISGP